MALTRGKRTINHLVANSLSESVGYEVCGTVACNLWRADAMLIVTPERATRSFVIDNDVHQLFPLRSHAKVSYQQITLSWQDLFVAMKMGPFQAITVW